MIWKYGFKIFMIGEKLTNKNKSINKRKICFLCLDALIVLLLVSFDQFTKQLAVAHLKGKPAVSLIKGVLELQYLENRGAAFGMLQGKKFFILFVGLVFLAVVLFFLWKLPDHRKYNTVHILVAVIIAGGIGNMADRFRLDYVVDFISFVLIRFPIFNVADIYVVVATICLFSLLLFIFKDEDLEFLSFRSEKAEKTEDL